MRARRLARGGGGTVVKEGGVGSGVGLAVVDYRTAVTRIGIEWEGMGWDAARLRQRRTILFGGVLTTEMCVL